jgi:hypothetical protein
MPRTEGAILDGDSRRQLRTPDLNQVIPITDVTVLDIDIGAAQIDSIGIGRGPRRRNTQGGSKHIGGRSQELDMEFRGILYRDPRHRHSRAIGNLNHGGRSFNRAAGVKSGPPSGALPVHDPAAVDGDIGQFRGVNKIRVRWEGPHGRHLQGRAGGKLESYVTFKCKRPAQESAAWHHNRPTASQRVDGGLDGGGIVGTARRSVIGCGGDSKGLGRGGGGTKEHQETECPVEPVQSGKFLISLRHHSFASNGFRSSKRNSAGTSTECNVYRVLFHKSDDFNAERTKLFRNCFVVFTVCF